MRIFNLVPPRTTGSPATPKWRLLARSAALACGLAACAEPADPGPLLVQEAGAQELSTDDRQPPVLEPSAHEPMIDMAKMVFRSSSGPPRINLTDLDRPFRVSFDWWSNGTSLPSLFRFTGRSPSGAVTVGELSADPSLDVVPLPGESTLTIDIEHQSQAPEFQANVLFEQEIKPEELGRCGDQVRDLFVRWVLDYVPWKDNWRCTFARETPPATLTFGWSNGAGTQTFRLRGVLPGTHGPILQLEQKSGDRVRLNTLLFFDGEGQLLRRVDGLYYFTLPDGNLLVSKAMADDGAYGYWYLVNEQVMAVSPAGDIVWERYIGGRPPGRTVMTAAGTLVMSWSQWETAGRQAAIHEIDPHTGATVDETFVDRSALCTAASTSPECLADQARRLAQFEAWWNTSGRTQISNPTPAGPYKVCNQYGCITGTLGGWLTLGSGATAEDVMEVSTYYTSFNGSQRTNSLLFSDASGTRTVGGKLVRRLGADRLLVSTALADSGFVPGLLWYSRSEELAAVGARGAIAWRRQLGASPALVFPPGTSTTHGADGYLLPGGQLYFTGWAMRNGDLTADSFWLDLASGVVAATPPPKRLLEGVCVP